jgi:cardiolipin synthase
MGTGAGDRFANRSPEPVPIRFFGLARFSPFAAAMTLWIIGGLLAAIILALALVGFLYLTRGVHVSRVPPPGTGDEGTPPVGDPFFCDTVALLTRTTLLPGHHAEITTNGNETYPKLWNDLRAAQRSITVQLYYCQPGRMADEFKAILVDRARAGVTVHFLADAFGAGPLKKEYYDELRAAGVHVSVFRPTKWYQLHKMQNRSHIRVVVVDGSVAWTGGFGLDDKWFGDGKSEDEWRDTNVRFEGPAVLQHQGTFVAAWAEATGLLLTGDKYFPPDEKKPDGDLYAGILHAAPTIGSTVAERFMALTITAAQKRLWISNAYFVPSDEQCDLLEEACKRGVDVRILTCNEDGDVPSTYYAGRTRYERLLGCGARIFEYQPVMMHAKTIVVDGMWSSVGTMNFDNRSMAHNDETLLLVRDERFGGRMEEIYEGDMRHCREIELATFRQRSLPVKLLEKAYGTLFRVL